VLLGIVYAAAVAGGLLERARPDQAAVVITSNGIPLVTLASRA
jgi:hypothetical protein